MRNLISKYKKYHNYIYLLSLLFCFSTVYNSIFDSKISLGGDNASYYILGNSIADGEGYKNIHNKSKSEHFHFPPGYPTIIAATIKTFSNRISVIKITNGLFFLGSIYVLFFLIISFTNNNFIAWISSLIVLFNYHLLQYSTIMMSEIPFTFFSLLSLFLFIKIDFEKYILRNYTFLLFLGCLVFSFYIRTIGIALLLSFTFVLIIQKKWKYSLVTVLSFTLLYLPWFLRNKSSHNSYTSQFFLKNPYQPELGTINFYDILERIIINIHRYITKEIPSALTHTKEVLYVDSSNIQEWIIGVTCIAFILLGLCKLTKHRNLVIIYIFSFFGILMLWPYVWYGTRFLLPLVPFLIFLFAYGIFHMIKLILKKVNSSKRKLIQNLTMCFLLIAWLSFYGYSSIQKLNKKAKSGYANNYTNYFEFAKWIKNNSSQNSVTCSRKGALFYLFSRKHVTGYLNTTNREKQIEYLKNKNVDYVVLEQLGYSSTSKYLLPAIDRYPQKFKIIKQLSNPNTYLMKFNSELGYWGDWKNEKRNGYGTYTWEDGQKYAGQWKNNLRHGDGELSFKNGEILYGAWTNGKLNGEVIKKNKAGQIIEKSRYENNIKVDSVNVNQ
ncbi:hypothetical protein BTO06_02825 [Tenacibaculum sp. SZ-18]|uniref:phospholipid carrier-dependent glycosyltransferase n=1 Tax=Tenacibaculum sp. SZ-18 TaxID=754423 RepID=UPI000C2D671D|nr:phospholipid carrier-dependent glycosyltransferase [Tenacibaculum sp. SZ-18]AUC14147.1 hypothetical protein BTO06_02825 [Tenacibaculum sp. SZ-18]